MRMRIVAPLVVALLVSHAGFGFAQTLPKGWRLPTADELTDELVQDSPVRFAKAAADFNGDGIEDEALILKSTTFNGEALWVRLSDGATGFRWLKLQQIKWDVEYHVDVAMGVTVAPPGAHPYACFDDAQECSFGDYKSRPKLRLRDPALVYFKPGSTASMFFWSKKRGKFLRVWLSD
jgi:hypothetical protein